MPRLSHTPGGDVVLEAYAAHLGIPVHDPPPGPYPMWNGTALKRPVTAKDWAHEIAHWLLAPPKRRLIVDYGWGQDAEFVGFHPSDPEPYGYGPRPDLDRLPWPDPKGDWPETQEEILACVLGFAFLVRAGVDATGTYDMYGFYRYACPPPDRQEPIKSVEPSTYRERREVQPLVAAFDRWRNTHLPISR